MKYLKGKYDKRCERLVHENYKMLLVDTKEDLNT